MRRINLKKCPKVDASIADLRPYEKHARIHSVLQLNMLEASMRRFGYTSPILISKCGDVIAGHARLIVRKRLGHDTIPAIILPDLNEEERRAYRIADNAIAEKGTWSLELLTEEIQLVSEFTVDFSPLEIGFEMGEIDSFRLQVEKQKVDLPIVPEPDRTRAAASRVGDIFQIGRHTVGCLDSKDPGSFAAVMKGRLAAAVISDQPWNLRGRFISGSADDFVEGFGEMSPDEFRDFTELVLFNQAAVCRPGALVYQFIDWRSVDMMIVAGKKSIGEHINLCVWVKTPGMGSLYRSAHELVCVFRKDGGKSQNHVALGKHGRSRSNVWTYDSPAGFGRERHKLQFHPTCKNETMIADAIMDCTSTNDIVLDAFLGSGTTVLSAHQCGRVGVGLELDPHYADLAVGRIAAATGKEPVHQDGRTFSQLTADRSAEQGV